MCLDQTDTAFVERCFANDLHYIDISANDPFLKKVEALRNTMKGSRTTALLSVGLAPGLTNLLAAHSNTLLDQTALIHISIMLGLGDSHGRTAMEWTLDQLCADFEVVENGSSRRAFTFKEGIRTDFGGTLGRRKAYRFNFSDQHSLAMTLVRYDKSRQAILRGKFRSSSFCMRQRCLRTKPGSTGWILPIASFFASSNTWV